MTKKQTDDKNKRERPRIYFEPGKRPQIKIENHTFEVEDISETGLRFLVDKEISLSKNISCSISFFKGDTLNIDATLLWTRGNAVGMQFNEPIAYAVLNKNQQAAFLKTHMTIPQLVKQEGVDQKGYTSKDIENLGVSQKRLKSFLISGYFETSIRDESGQPAQNLFSRTDLYKLSVLNNLIKRGMPDEEAALKIKILSTAVKNALALLVEKPFLYFPATFDFNSLSSDVKTNLFQILSFQGKYSDEERQQLLTILKQLAPTFITERKKNTLIQESKENARLILNLEKIRKQVDRALAEPSKKPTISPEF